MTTRIATARRAAAAGFGAVLAGTGIAAAQSGVNDAGLFGEDEQTLRLGSADRNLTLSPFVQLDGGYFSREPGDEGFEDELRLARLYLFGTYDDFSMTLAYEFNNDPFPVRYAFFNYDVNDRFDIQIGQQDEPFSIQDYSGSRFLPFAEAGQSASLIPGDRIGAVLRYHNDLLAVQGGVFAGDVNQGVWDQGYAVTVRATAAPIYSESEIKRGGRATPDGVGVQRVDDLLHLGLAVSARADVEDAFSFTGGASSSLVNDPIADAGSFPDTTEIYRGNLELARSKGSFSFQSELTGAYLDGGPDGGFSHGGYAYVTYILTGERRGYDRNTGTFGRVIPQAAVGSGGYGAYEIGARVDYLDLTDLGPRGGAQIGASVVGNAYLTKRIVLTADYSFTEGLAGPSEDTTVNALTFRLQYAY